MMVGSRRSEEVVDPTIETRPSTSALKRALLTALRCVDPDSNKRPKMSQVVRMLESEEYPIPREVWFWYFRSSTLFEFVACSSNHAFTSKISCFFHSFITLELWRSFSDMLECNLKTVLVWTLRIEDVQGNMVETQKVKSIWRPRTQIKVTFQSWSRRSEATTRHNQAGQDLYYKFWSAY